MLHIDDKAVLTNINNKTPTMTESNKWEAARSIGNAPPPMFGHTVTPISKTKIVLFGGAIGTYGNFTMTSDCYLYNLFKEEWIKLSRTLYFK